MYQLTQMLFLKLRFALAIVQLLFIIWNAQLVIPFRKVGFMKLEKDVAYK